jgi:glycosyltransferase involved in cell wall biosynthesis
VTATRVAFVNEGRLGAGGMGHPQMEAALRAGLAGRDDVIPEFVQIRPMSTSARSISRPVPGLARFDIDFQQQRWQLVQAFKGRRVIGHHVRRDRPDAIHVHSHSAALALGGLLRDLPVVVSVDASVQAWQAMGVWREVRRHSPAMVGLSQWLERRLFRQALLVQAWTAWTRDTVLAACPTARVIELHPGLDLDHYRPVSREERSQLRVLFVGGRFAQKGGRDLIEALGPELGRSVELDVVTPSSSVESRAGMRVHRIGPGDRRLVHLFQQADVFCLPTRADAVPWVVVEAMACGTPVVASAIGGIPDLLDHGAAGSLVEPGDVDGLRAALGALLDDGSRRASMAAAARRRAEACFDARHQTAKLIDALASARGA